MEHHTNEEAQIAVAFVTRSEDPYKVPESSITVPASVTRYGLSQIVNHLLNLENPIPFEFLIDEEVLRVSLGGHVGAKGISTESVLQVEYFPAVLPPELNEEHQHDDWVSCMTRISGHGATEIVSGCYDGMVRVWEEGEQVASFAAHDGPMKTCVAVTSTNQLLTAGGDGEVYVWEMKEKEYPRMMARFCGHENAVEAAAVRPDGERCATAGWDMDIMVWRCGESLQKEMEDNPRIDGEALRKKKKTRKGNGSTGAVAPQDQAKEAHQETCLGSLEGHAQCVSDMKWVSNDQIASSSWDHSIKMWDVEMETVVSTYQHNKVIYCLDTVSGTDANVIIFGGAEKAVRIWDRRQKHELLAKALRSLSSHTSWVSCIACHPTSHHHMLTASYDGTAKIWDLRAEVPLYTLRPANESESHPNDLKLLCCTWLNDTSLAFGGTNNMVSTMTLDSLLS